MKFARSSILLVTLALGFAACSSPKSIGSASSTATPVVAPCGSNQVHVTSLGVGAGTGNVDQVFGFTNVSKSDCTLAGYPKITALNSQGAYAAEAVEELSGIGGVHTGASTPPRVTLKAGQMASSMVSGTDMPIGVSAACPPAYPAFLVAPPGTAQSVKLTAVGRPGFPACTPIKVNPIVPGRTGQLPAGPVEVPTAVQPDKSPPTTIAPEGVPTPTTA
jgi:hypothetical protein